MPHDNIGQMSGVVPLLQVGNMSGTLLYYQDALGFTLDFVWPEEGPPKWAQVSRSGVRFMFTVDLGTSSARFIAEKGNGVVFYVIADDVEALLAEFTERGAIIVQEIHRFGGRKQFSVADSDGYVIAFSQEFS